jgi:tetratricopeptide (TPR) repeat protein
MEEQVEIQAAPGSFKCPVCSSIREDPSAERCPSCGSDLSALIAIEKFAESLILDARNDIRQRKYTEARTKLDIASSIDERNSIIAKLIGVDIDIQQNNFEPALNALKEIATTGLNTAMWGVNLQEKTSEVQHKIELEKAAKEHYNLALHRSKEGYFAEAREELYKSADLAPYLAEIYLLAAKVDFALGAENAVYEDLIRYRQLRPDDPRGLRMEMELINRNFEKRIHHDQLIYAVGMIIFAIAILIIIAIK